MKRSDQHRKTKRHPEKHPTVYSHFVPSPPAAVCIAALPDASAFRNVLDIALLCGRAAADLSQKERENIKKDGAEKMN